MGYSTFSVVSQLVEPWDCSISHPILRQLVVVFSQSYYCILDTAFGFSILLLVHGWYIYLFTEHSICTD